MIDLDDVDLAKALDMLSKAIAQLARDIPLELDSPERTHEVADLLDQTTRLLRARGLAMAPKVIDLDAAEPSNDNARLAAGLALLAYQLTMIAPEIRAGLFDQSEREELAEVLITLAKDLRDG